MNSLLILGAGGFAREAYHWLNRRQYDPIGFFADEFREDHRLPLAVIRDLSGFKGVHFLTAVGDPSGRQLLSKRAILAGLIPCEPIIYYNSVVGHAKIGKNSIICPGVVITSHVVIGEGALINLNCTLGHDCVLEDYVTLSPGVNLSGNVRVGTRTYLGTNCSVREKIHIGHDCFLGMGAVLTKDMPPGEIWTGIPARIKK